jgi:hypothetical protein
MATFVLSNEELLRKLVYNPNAVSAFSFLKTLQAAAPPAGCPSCVRKKYEGGFRKAAEQTKLHIVNMSQDDILRLKEFLGVSADTQVIVWYLHNNKTEKKVL